MQLPNTRNIAESTNNTVFLSRVIHIFTGNKQKYQTQQSSNLTPLDKSKQVNQHASYSHASACVWDMNRERNAGVINPPL
ncbi:hypothetical protein TDB9533_03076 [Thalassocella blandensis]|nr:hypothetical protein TDB9533_03076 [Thalassocella blandensis]